MFIELPVSFSAPCETDEALMRLGIDLPEEREDAFKTELALINTEYIVRINTSESDPKITTVWIRSEEDYTMLVEMPYDQVRKLVKYNSSVVFGNDNTEDIPSIELGQL